MIPIISFIGSSGSGKTTLLEKVVSELRDHGLRVAVFKHTPHDDLRFDEQGKDSRRFCAAGAEVVVVSSPEEMVLMKKMDHDISPAELSLLVGTDIDIILTEGFKKANTLKIEVHRKTQGPDLLLKEKDLLAVITDEPLDIAVPQFDFAKDNTADIARLIQEAAKVNSIGVVRAQAN